MKDIQRPLVITEGKTDWQHMKAALARLRSAGQYEELDFDFHEYTDFDMGDSALSTMCEQFSKVPQARRVIFIFDRDKPAIVAAMESAELGYKNWGNNVYSFCIPVPAHRAEYHRISIESYYTDAEVKTVHPESGLRLVFSNEVQKLVQSSLTNRGESKVSVQMRPAPDAEEELQKVVYDQDCDAIVNAQGQRVAHSKTVFAQLVLGATPPFNAFGLGSFNALFDRIRQVLVA